MDEMKGMSPMEDHWLYEFISESNRIENKDYVRLDDIDAHIKFLMSDMDVGQMREFMRDWLGASLRDKSGLDVRVGNYTAPPGGPAIEKNLSDLLNDVTSTLTHARGCSASKYAHRIHHDYEMLHPWTDGNGRSGRLLWLKIMLNGKGRDVYMVKNYGFLRSWYYQSLEFQIG